MNIKLCFFIIFIVFSIFFKSNATSVVNSNEVEVKLNSDLKRLNVNERHKRDIENSGTAEVDNALTSGDASAETSTQEIQFSTERTNPFLTEATLKIGPIFMGIWWETKTKLEANFTIDLTNVDKSYFTGRGKNKKLKFSVELSLNTEKQIDPLKGRDDFKVTLGTKSVTRKQSFENVDRKKRYVFKVKVIYENTDLSEPEEFILSEDVGKSIAEANRKEPNIYALQFDKEIKVAHISIAIWVDLKSSNEEEGVRLIGNYTLDLENISEKFFTGTQRELKFKVELQLVPDNEKSIPIKGGDDIVLQLKKVKDSPSITRRVPFTKLDPNEKYSLKLHITYDSTNADLKDPEEFILSTDVLKSIDDVNREIRARTKDPPTEQPSTVETNEPSTEDIMSTDHSGSTDDKELKSTTTEADTGDATTMNDKTEDTEVETESEVTTAKDNVEETENTSDETSTTKSEEVTSENPTTTEAETMATITETETVSETSEGPNGNDKSTNVVEETTVEVENEKSTEESKVTETAASATSTNDEITENTVSESETSTAKITDKEKTDETTDEETKVPTDYSSTTVEDTTISDSESTTQRVSNTEDSTTEVTTENTEKATDTTVTYPPESSTEESSESSSVEPSSTASEQVTSDESSSEGDTTIVTDAETTDITTHFTTISESNTEDEVTTAPDEEVTTAFEETTVKTEMSTEDSESTAVSETNTEDESTTVSLTTATDEITDETTDQQTTDSITDISLEGSSTKINTTPLIVDTTEPETEPTAAKTESTTHDVTSDETTAETSKSSTEQSTSSEDTAEPIITDIPTTTVVDSASTTDESLTSEVLITTEAKDTTSVTDQSITSEESTSVEQSSATATDATVSSETTSETNTDQSTVPEVTSVTSEVSEVTSVTSEVPEVTSVTSEVSEVTSVTSEVPEVTSVTSEVSEVTSVTSEVTDTVSGTVASEESIGTDESTSAQESTTAGQSSTPLIDVSTTTAETDKPGTTQEPPTTHKVTETTRKSTEARTTPTEVFVEESTSQVTDSEPVTTEVFVNFTEPFLKDVHLKIGVAKTRLWRPFPSVISFSYDLNASKLNEMISSGRYQRSVLFESDKPKLFDVTLETVLKSIGQSDEITHSILHSLNMNEKNHFVKSSHTFNDLDPKKRYEASLRALYHTKLGNLPDNEVVVVSSDVAKDIEKSNAPKTGSAPAEDNSWKIATGSVAALALLIIVIAVIIVRNNKRKLKHTVTGKNHMRNGSLLDDSVATLPRGAISLKEYPKNGIDNEAFQEDSNSRNSTLSGNHFVVTKYSLPVNVAEFNSVYKSLRESSFAKICDEFKKVKQITETKIIALASQRNAKMTNNRLKNRFANIVPYDHSRVKLTANSDVLGADYINANYIPGLSSKKEYIATQGPLRKTLTDFWRMVCEQNITVIVNLTQSMEGDIVKCETYWPTLFENGAEANLENGSSQPTLTVGSYRITLKSETNVGDFTIRDLEVLSPKKTFVVKQYHLTQWPDFQSPRSPRYLLNLIKSVRKHVDEKQLDTGTQTAPILVHCSAGVGRTGTFIAVDRLYQELVSRNAPQIDVFGTVMDMRQHRVHMVQTEDQYIFIYECIAALIDEIYNGSNTIRSKSSKGSVTSYPSLPRAATGVTKTNDDV